MGRNKGKGRGLSAIRKNRPAIPLEWITDKRAAWPLEWWKNPGGIYREWDEEQSFQGASTLTEWKSCLGGTNPSE